MNNYVLLTAAALASVMIVNAGNDRTNRLTIGGEAVVSTPLGTLGCRIDFMLRYELALGSEKLAGPLIDRAANQMVDAFVRRAEAIYGDPGFDAPGQPGRD